MRAAAGPRQSESRLKSRGFVLWELLIVVAAATAFVADDKVPVRPASEARDHIDKKGTYEMKVRLSKNAEPDKIYYLDSEADYHDEKNLAIVIAYADAEKFKKAGVDDPSAYYKGKTIRVSGMVIKESRQTRIHVTDPAQIEVVPEPKAAAGDKP